MNVPSTVTKAAEPPLTQAKTFLKETTPPCGQTTELTLESLTDLTAYFLSESQTRTSLLTNGYDRELRDESCPVSVRLWGRATTHRHASRQLKVLSTTWRLWSRRDSDKRGKHKKNILTNKQNFCSFYILHCPQHSKSFAI
ncbi:hypothetical protein E3U43_017153 [Larimichthys crocea]|uniref:Uncharacterized protein n=1 Tax=Larimichthys crocea TaxID=215358 RepID=A0ACD3QYG4_LARCR|nr:hypothetical protein E3U43_017153 [Larimichthys crocea]